MDQFPRPSYPDYQEGGVRNRSALRTTFKGHYHIQSQESKICQILPCQRLSLQVGMDETKTPQPEYSGSITGEVRNGNPLLVSDYDEFDGSPAAYQNTDLPSNLI